MPDAVEREAIIALDAEAEAEADADADVDVSRESTVPSSLYGGRCKYQTIAD